MNKDDISILVILVIFLVAFPISIAVAIADALIVTDKEAAVISAMEYCEEQCAPNSYKIHRDFCYCATTWKPSQPPHGAHRVEQE